MDYMRKKYIEMQELAEKIIAIKKGGCMDDISSSDICLDNNSYIPSISKWFRLKGFRMNLDRESTMDHLGTAVNKWIRSSTGTGSDAAYVISCNAGNMSFLYGLNNDVVMSSFRSNVSECDICKVTPNLNGFNYNGIFTGTFSANGLADSLIAAKIRDYYIACIFTPVSDSEIHKLLDTNRMYCNILEEYKTYQRVYGNQSKRVENVSLPVVNHALEVLKEEMEYIEANIGKGFVRAVIRFGSDSEDNYRLLSAIISESFNFERRNGLEPVRGFRLNNINDGLGNILAVPYVCIRNKGFSGNIHTLTLQSSENIGTFCIPALSSSTGFYIRNYNVDENSIDDFPLIEMQNGKKLLLGKSLHNGECAGIPCEKLGQHSFVTGSTGSGKTTTVKKILCDAYKKNIPFVVIEAAKKEYFTLMSCIPELQIYTAGTDGRKLAFNPLQPEDGVLIENHVAAVVRALLACTGGEHPIPEAFNGLLKQTYKDFGWEYGQLSYTDEYKPFPTFRDVFANVDKYIANHAHYGTEVKQNLTAALSLRTETMYDGALGNLFANNCGLQSKELLETPCVIELSDFSEESVAFLMNILLFKFQCYLSHKPETTELKRIIAVEEAHNVFRKTSMEDTGRALSNNYFDKMLAEIRSSGTGLIISDQRPGLLSEAVMANTAVKVIHGLSEYEDRELVGLAANLSSFQIKRLSELKAGEGLIAIRGIHGVQHVIVDMIENAHKYNSSCHICSNRFRCKKTAVENMLNGMDLELIKYHVTKIMASPYNPRILESNITDMLRALNIVATSGTKLCFLGEVLNRYGDASLSEQRVITQTFTDYLGGKCL